MKKVHSILMLVLFIAVCFAVSGISALFTAGSVSGWYPTLLKPSWTPPSWLFGPVWTLLYLMLAVAAWLIWREKGS
jgi:benzodiazapine receptor